jgi:hypothetical protein
MVALLRLCGPSRRGNRVNWNLDDEDDLLEQLDESTSPEEDTMECRLDICIICYKIESDFLGVVGSSSKRSVPRSVRRSRR